MSQLVFGLLTGCHVVLICWSCPSLHWSIDGLSYCFGLLVVSQLVLVYWLAVKACWSIGELVVSQFVLVSQFVQAARLCRSVGVLSGCICLLASWSYRSCVGLLVVSHIVSVCWRALRGVSVSWSYPSLCQSIGGLLDCVGLLVVSQFVFGLLAGWSMVVAVADASTRPRRVQVVTLTDWGKLLVRSRRRCF